MTNHDERRDYYRIEDTVGLSFETCTESELPSNDEFLRMAPDEFQLINHLKNLDLENSKLLHTIQEESPDIARYLKLVNLKIEALAKNIITKGLTDEIATTEVTLSAGGINLISQNMLATENYIKLRMILYPSTCVINCYAKVVRSEPCDGGFDSAFEYFLITESDRDILVRHVLQLQSNTLRKQTAQEN
ncbi:MAG: PilZ domain-containing protein [Enterobacterales bacterium]|nr:PilZ domain-containing protein [Enterobacterales bacterium]